MLNPKNHTAEDIRGILEEYFRDKEEISLVFIFGSAVSGRLTGQSDLDIAVLFRNMPDFHNIIKTKGEISEATDREIDLVVLNNSSPIIRMQVLKNGKLIRSGDGSEYSNFFVGTVKEYDDLKRIRKEAEKNILRGSIYA